MKNAKYANLDFSWSKLLLVLIQYVSLQRWNVIPAALETVVPVYIRMLIYLSMISMQIQMQPHFNWSIAHSEPGFSFSRKIRNMYI